MPVELTQYRLSRNGTTVKFEGVHRRKDAVSSGDFVEANENIRKPTPPVFPPIYGGPGVPISTLFVE